jgi:hypothetical protein
MDQAAVCPAATGVHTGVVRGRGDRLQHQMSRSRKRQAIKTPDEAE